jgi:hypothetical protein
MSGYETHIPGHGVFCASSSDEFNTGGSYAPWKAFIKNTTSYFITSHVSGSHPASYNSDGTPTGISRFEGVLGSWLKLKLPYDILLRRINIARRFDHAELFNTALLYGSVDDVSWDVLHNIQMPASYINVDFEINATKVYKYFVVQITKGRAAYQNIGEWRLFGTPGPTTLDKGSLTLGRSLDVPRISRYDVDTETPRPEKLLLDFDTTVNESPIDISGQENHGRFVNGASYSAGDKAFDFDGTNDAILGIINNPAGDWVHSLSFWFKLDNDQSTISSRIQPFQIARQGTGGVSRTSDLPSADLAGHVSGLDVAPTVINWYFYGNDASFPISGIKANEWHHMTLAYEGGGAVASRHCFFDGVEIFNTGASTANLNVFANSILAIGKDHARTSSSPSYFPGQISNFKVYNVALEASEAKKLYNLGRTGRSMVISDTAVGIGKVPKAQLDVNGTIKGINMTTCPVFFDASAASTTAYLGLMNFNNVTVNKGGALSGTTFTASITGYYQFHIFCMGAYTTGANQLWVSFMKNGAESGTTATDARVYDNTTGYSTLQSHSQVAGSAIIYLTVGDYVQMKNWGSTAVHGSHNRFQGIYLSA